MHTHGGHHRHGPGLGHGMSMGAAGRVRRGDVQPAVLALLKEQDMHGYQIIQELAERTKGAWMPSPGSIYPTLRLLEQQGFVASEQLAGRRVFSLTASGRELAGRLPDVGPWNELAAESDPSRRLRETFHGLMTAAMQVGRTGTSDQVVRTVAILDDARRRVYRVLAGEE